MRKSLLSPFLTLGAMFALILALVGGSAAVFGQATPDAADGASDGPVHPAHIHAGMCPEVGDVVFPLENVVVMDHSGMASPDAMSSPMADAGMSGTPMAADSMMALGSTTVVEASLDDILGAEHAINVHQSPEDLSVYVACGDITGEAQDGELVVDLGQLNDSGVEGQATLTDNGDGTTTVVIELRHVGMSMEGTPESTPKP